MISLLITCFIITSNILLTIGRNYSAVFSTLNRTFCDTSNTISIYFASNCSYFSGGEATRYFNSDSVIKTSTQTFIPAGIGLSETVSFNDTDIGEITHLYLSASGTDGWCIDEFSILIDDETNEWRTCSFSFMSFMSIDGDCTDNGGVSVITLDVSNSSLLCRSSTSDINVNSSQSMQRMEYCVG